MTGEPSWLTASDDEVRFLYRALLLSPSLDVCEAILRGEHVPRSRLDPEGLRRLKL